MSSEEESYFALLKYLSFLVKKSCRDHDSPEQEIEQQEAPELLLVPGGVVMVTGAGPDVFMKVHYFLLQRELRARDLHPAGEHSLQGQETLGDGGVDGHVEHEPPPDGGGGDGGLGRTVRPGLLLRVDLQTEAGLGEDLLD